MVKAADMLIARRADTQARADFATWKMMAKLNGLSNLPPEAQRFLARYGKLLQSMGEAEATEATIAEVYKAYYVGMGGGGTPPNVRPPAADPVENNVTAFRRPAAKPKVSRFGTAMSGGPGKRPLPVALIFACLAVIYVAIRYYWR